MCSCSRFDVRARSFDGHGLLPALDSENDCHWNRALQPDLSDGLSGLKSRSFNLQHVPARSHFLERETSGRICCSGSRDITAHFRRHHSRPHDRFATWVSDYAGYCARGSGLRKNKTTEKEKTPSESDTQAKCYGADGLWQRPHGRHSPRTGIREHPSTQQTTVYHVWLTVVNHTREVSAHIDQWPLLIPRLNIEAGYRGATTLLRQRIHYASRASGISQVTSRHHEGPQQAPETRFQTETHAIDETKSLRPAVSTADRPGFTHAGGPVPLRRTKESVSLKQ